MVWNCFFYDRSAPCQHHTADKSLWNPPSHKVRQPLVICTPSPLNIKCLAACESQITTQKAHNSNPGHFLFSTPPFASDQQQEVIRELSALRRYLRKEQRQLETQLDQTDRQESRSTPPSRYHHSRPANSRSYLRAQNYQAFIIFLSAKRCDI